MNAAATTAMPAGPHLGRLRWHSRRALLELDIVLERFWARHGERLSGERAKQLEQLLELEDHDLWETVCGRRKAGDPRLNDLIALLREV